MRNTWFSFLLLSGLFLYGCGSGSENKGDGFISEESLGLRHSDLYSEDSTSTVAARFDAAAPGQSQRYQRSFENAPPLIPHSTTGFLPITAKQNLCLSCHLPEMAPKTKATPIPRSHFMSFRPEIEKIDGKIWNYSDDAQGNSVTTTDLKGHLSNARYNCSQCHVPQAYTTVILTNNFEADFRKEELKNRSNFADVIKEGVN